MYVIKLFIYLMFFYIAMVFRFFCYRIGTIFSFGYVSLTISGLRSDDQGTYTCRATNKSGEDMTQANVTVQVHR